MILIDKCRYKNAKIKPCEIHGFEYAVFKCRYCCNQSVWFCFGTTHFCDSCHNNHGNLTYAVYIIIFLIILLFFLNRM